MGSAPLKLIRNWRLGTHDGILENGSKQPGCGTALATLRLLE